MIDHQTFPPGSECDKSSKFFGIVIVNLIIPPSHIKKYLLANRLELLKELFDLSFLIAGPLMSSKIQSIEQFLHLTNESWY